LRHTLTSVPTLTLANQPQRPLTRQPAIHAPAGANLLNCLESGKAIQSATNSLRAARHRPEIEIPLTFGNHSAAYLKVSLPHQKVDW
jgi:hypothetical protein